MDTTPRIGIIAAMQLELDGFLSHLKEHKTVSYGNIHYHTGTIEGKDIALMRCGIGKVNAAVGTTLLIDKLKPDYVINTGVAGGFARHLHIGDIVVSTEVGHHDADVTVFKYLHGQIPDMPPTFAADPALVEYALASFPAGSGHAAHRGIIVSGDSFIHKNRQIRDLQKKFPRIAAVEMEGSAIAQTCYLFATPFVVIRSISDLVFKKQSHDDYQGYKQYAADISVGLVRNLITRL